METEATSLSALRALCMCDLFRQSMSCFTNCRSWLFSSNLLQTFFIADPNAAEMSSKPARACETCYETVFPLLDPPTNGEGITNPMFSSFLSSSVGTARLTEDTTTALPMLPTWVSMPSLPTQGSQPQALMQMTDADISTDVLDISEPYISTNVPGTSDLQSTKRGHVRLKLATRPRSYHQIPKDFSQQGHQLGILPSSLSTLIDFAIEENPESSESEGLGSATGERYFNDIPLPTPPSSNPFSQPPSPSPRRKRDDIVKRSKRFSLPAVALYPTNVTTRTSVITSSNGSGSSSGASESTGIDNVSGAMGRLRKLSLVSYARN